MTTETIAGVDVALNDEGFLEQPDQWTEDMAVEIARREGIDPLTPRHWQVINFMRDEYYAKGTGPSVRALGKTSGRLDQGALPALPEGPGQARGEDRGHPQASRLHLEGEEP